MPQPTPTTPVEVADLLDSEPSPSHLDAVFRRSLGTGATTPPGVLRMWMAGRLLHLDRVEGRA